MEVKVGNVLKNGYGDVVVVTSIKTHTPMRGEPYTYISYDYYGESNCSGGVKEEGEYDTVSCPCWYDKWERFYHSEYPDPECEECGGSGDIKVYRPGLKDCTLLAETVKEYRKMKIKSKIVELEDELKGLES
jgi:hypothetical protein